MITAIILAGGTGSRVGADRPKQFVEVLGKPVLAYTIEIFQRHTEIEAIEVVCHKDWRNYLDEIVRKYNFTKVKWIVDGGKTFQDSCRNGVEYLKDKIAEEDYVLIQYGAAPFTSSRIISDVIKIMKEKGPAVSVTPCYQLLGSNDGSESRTWIDRDKYIQIACPSGFRYGCVLDIYRRAGAKGLLETVDPHITSLVYALGDTLYQAYGDQTNIKITTKEDIELFEGYVLRQNMLRCEAENTRSEG